MTAFMVGLWAFIGLTALGLTVMGIFLTHVRAMNAADAAAEGALLALKEPMLQAMTDRSAQNLARLWQEVSEEVVRRVDEWESDYREWRQRELEGSLPPVDPGEIDRIIDEEVAERRPNVAQSYQRSAVWSRKPEIADLLLSGDPLPIRVQFQHFLTSAEVGCIAKQAGETHQSKMVEWAGEFSLANRAEPPGNRGVLFSADGTAKVRVLIPYRVRFFVLDEYVGEEHRYLTGEAVHQLEQVAGIPVRVPGACPR